MKSRREFLTYFFLAVSAMVTSLVMSSCGAKPDAETEPSPEWPPPEK